MNQKLQKQYQNCEPIALLYDGCYDSIMILDVENLDDDYLIVKYKNRIVRVKVISDIDGDYFYLFGQKWFLSDTHRI